MVEFETVSNEKSKSKPSANGFSKRFNQMLDTLKFPESKRYTKLSRLLDVSINATRGWCQDDISPRKVEDLNEIVKTLLTKFSSEATDYTKVAAWLLFGDTVKCQFNSYQYDDLLIAEIYSIIISLSADNNIDLEEIEPLQRSKIFKTAINLSKNYGKKPASDPRFQDVIIGMLSLASNNPHT